MPHYRRGPLGRRSTAKVKNQIAPASELTAADWRFIEEYLLTLDVVGSARAAEFANPTATGYALLARPNIQEALRQARAFRSARAAVAADQVLRRWWLLATADVNDLMEMRIVACRHCHGIDHRWQFRDHELREAEAAHRREMMKIDEEKRVPFDDRGGGGYSTNAPPNPDCPGCDGNGVPHGIIKDSRYLSPAGRALYNGFEVKADGSVKIKLRDRGFAETMVAKHLGMFPRNVENPAFDPEKLSPRELEQMLNSLPVAVREQIEAMFQNAGDDPRTIEQVVK